MTTSSEKHFWVSTSPFFETTLLSLMLPSAGSVPGCATKLRLFDSDGALVNEASIELTAGLPGMLELDPLLGSCKIESGMKHAHLVVSSTAPVMHLCRIHTREGASLMGELRPVWGTHRICIPLSFDAGRFGLLPLVNYGEEEAVVRARFFCGNRSPEMLWTIAPRATKLIDTSGEFSEYVEGSRDGRVQGYLRLGVRGEYSVGAQLIECMKGVKEGNYFSGIA